MNLRQITTWLETHWVNPAYSGWVLGGLSFFFFVAATNTLAGWLYVLSGVGLALLTIAAYLCRQSLNCLQVQRSTLEPVSAGDYLTIELTLTNSSTHPQTLLQVQDCLPPEWNQTVKTAIEQVPAQGQISWLYHQAVAQRGIYRWQIVELRTAAPLGLCWYRRNLTVPARAIVYPIVLSLSHCPLLDEIGRERDPQFQSQERPLMASEGITRTLRPYRWGDSTRLIHWRTSARYGELRVREMEIFQGGQSVILCLDSHDSWQDCSKTPSASHSPSTPPDSGDSRIPRDSFEQAVIAAASLYFYAGRHSIPIQLWTAATGVIQGNRKVLETLAATQPQEPLHMPLSSREPVIWLTQNPQSLASLPEGSRWILWLSRKNGQGRSSPPSQTTPGSSQTHLPGLAIDPDSPLDLQLQTPLGSLTPVH